MPQANNKAEGGSTLFGFFIDADMVMEFIDSAGDSEQRRALHKITTAMEKEGIDLGSQSATTVPQASTRAGRILKLIVLGEKVVKLVFGEDENASGNVLFVNLEDAFKQSGSKNKREFNEYVKNLQVQYSRSGVVVMDPVWLSDPAPGSW